MRDPEEILAELSAAAVAQGVDVEALVGPYPDHTGTRIHLLATRLGYAFDEVITSDTVQGLPKRDRRPAPPEQDEFGVLRSIARMAGAN
jgi:hypothetical protein